MLFAGEFDQPGTEVGQGCFAELDSDAEVELVAFPHGLIESGVGEELVNAMKENEETIRKTLRTVPVDVSKQGKNQPTIIEEEVEVADVKFLLSLAKL